MWICPSFHPRLRRQFQFVRLNIRTPVSLRTGTVTQERLWEVWSWGRGGVNAAVVHSAETWLFHWWSSSRLGGTIWGSEDDVGQTCPFKDLRLRETVFVCFFLFSSPSLPPSSTCDVTDGHSSLVRLPRLISDNVWPGLIDTHISTPSFEETQWRNVTPQSLSPHVTQPTVSPVITGELDCPTVPEGVFIDGCTCWVWICWRQKQNHYYVFTHFSLCWK